MHSHQMLPLVKRTALLAIALVVVGSSPSEGGDTRTTAASQSEETCTLKTYASSWMETGTPFTVECGSGVYSGTLITTPARRFFRRGSLTFKFDRPLFAHGNAGGEGKFQMGRGHQIMNMAVSGGVGIASKDLFDGVSTAVFKSYYMIPITFTALAFFSNGGDILLKPGYQLKVIPRE
jgi:hypothetical protein